MSLFSGNYGHYNSSGNVLYGGYNAEKVAASSDFEVALSSYAAAKMWTDPDKKDAIAAAKKLVGLPGLKRKRYASTNKDERKRLTAAIRGLTADMTPIARKHGMQLLREATGARLRPRVSTAAKQLYSAEFVDYPMNDYRNWMSPIQFAQGVPNGLYTPNPRRPVPPSQKRIARSMLQKRAIVVAKEYASRNGWAKPYVVPLAAAAMRLADMPDGTGRDAMTDNYSKSYSYMSKDPNDVTKALVDIIDGVVAAKAGIKSEVKSEAAASSTNDGMTDDTKRF